MKERSKKIIAAEAKLIQKQQNEMNALKKKLEANLNERLKLRETDIINFFKGTKTLRKKLRTNRILNESSLRRLSRTITQDQQRHQARV